MSGFNSTGVLKIVTGCNLNRYGKTSSSIWGGAVKSGF